MLNEEEVGWIWRAGLYREWGEWVKTGVGKDTLSVY